VVYLASGKLNKKENILNPEGINLKI